jgi:hypothetical protein
MVEYIGRYNAVGEYKFIKYIGWSVSEEEL